MKKDFEDFYFRTHQRNQMKNLCFLCAVVSASLFFTTCVSAQAVSPPATKDVTHLKLGWFDFFEIDTFRNKFVLQSEITERFFVDPKAQYLSGVRFYGLYKLNESWFIGPGFSVWFPKSGDIHTYEFRPAQQFFYKQKMEKRKRVGIAHRFLMEERIVRNVANGEIADGYTFSVRFRYRFAFDYRIVKMGKKEYPLKVFVNDEVFLQGGEHVIYNIFDQNRFFCGVSAKFAKGTTVAAGYGNVFKATRFGNLYDDLHVFRVSFTHELNVKKKD